MAERMRFNLKLFVAFLVTGSLFFTLTLWTRCDNKEARDNNFYREIVPQPSVDVEEKGEIKPPWTHLNQVSEDKDDDDDQLMDQNLPIQEIPCVINDDYSVPCRKDGDEVYLPFSFIAKYFEVYGKVAENDGQERFEWKHSYSRAYQQTGNYSPEGPFMSFEHYNVEVRDRVKCISGIEGVPISTQWGPQGYFYPIQIAQYGLSHWSKYLRDKSRSVVTVEDAESADSSLWGSQSDQAHVSNTYDPLSQSRVIEFTAPESVLSPGVSMMVESTSNFFLELDLKLVNNGSFSVAVEPKGKHPQTFYVHYVCSSTMVSVTDNHIYYGIGERTSWSRITRDLTTDFQKGIKLKKTKVSSKTLHRIVSIALHGHGWLDNVTVASNAHLAQFYSAANWLVMNQDSKGGWPIMVTRKLASGKLELQPGWYSAMAQGQAMSLLVRAYLRTRNWHYIDTATKATKLFDVPSERGGVLARFAGKYPWYEEYPTTPSCLVLNGFIYSLLGLYDLKVSVENGDETDAGRLYQAGIASLRAMLPLFDTGSGSIYDLRHFTLGVAPNLARWDYHATHVTQLLLLSTIDPDPVFESTAKRWLGYMKGKRAAHN